MKNAVSYYRYSSHGQRETSIEGQRKSVTDYAKREGYNIIREYIDRAQTGTTDKRSDFQRMMADAAKQKFEAVLVYSLDRFGRNLRESIFNEYKLKTNGIALFSATEDFKDNPSGRLYRNMQMSFAQYYSDELSEKVKRGIAISVEKGKYIGGYIPMGFAVDDDKYYTIDPLTAPVIQKIFELYAAGYTLKKINDEITKIFGKSYFGNFSNSLNRILENRNYIGIYTRKGANIKDGMPRIVSDELFEKVQLMRKKDKKTPAKARAHEEYLLTTKLFCGHCKERIKEDVYMVGISGTSKTGAIHNYYSCKNVWTKKGCNKKNVKKSLIEDFVLSHAREQLTDENIALVAKAVSDISKRDNNTPIIADIKKKLKENAAATENLLKAIECGEHIDLLSERITLKKQERETLEKALSREQWEKAEIDENEIKFFLMRLKNGDINDMKYKRAIIAIFVNAVYLYDDRATIVFNATDRPVTVDYEMILDKMGEDACNASGRDSGESSYMTTTAPPQWDCRIYGNPVFYSAACNTNSLLKSLQKNLRKTHISDLLLDFFDDF